MEWGRCGTVRVRLCGQGMATPVTGRRTRPFATGERLDCMCVLSLYLVARISCTFTAFIFLDGIVTQTAAEAAWLFPRSHVSSIKNGPCKTQC